ncbi:hypothetical protein RYX36_036799, partial [Vicia faba]
STLVNNRNGEIGGTDPRYVSFLNIDWNQITNVLENLKDKETYQGVGLLNFNDSEIDNWKQLVPETEHVVLHLNYASTNITWEDLYPEWIDEEEEYEFPTCPSLPKIQVPGKPRLDLIAVKLPCNKSGRWSRDVARLHLQIEAARLAATSKGLRPVRVLFVTDCFPTPNLFTCKDIIRREGNVWLYEPNLHKLREKLQLPIGSIITSFLDHVLTLGSESHTKLFAYLPKIDKASLLAEVICEEYNFDGVGESFFYIMCKFDV